MHDQRLLNFFNVYENMIEILIKTLSSPDWFQLCISSPEAGVNNELTQCQ